MTTVTRRGTELDDLRHLLRAVLRGLWRRRWSSPEDLPGEPRLTARHLAILAHVGTEGPLTVGDIAVELGLSLPAASKLTRELEMRSLVHRTEHVDDRRRTVVDLNALTSKRVEAWLEDRNRPLLRTLAALSASERRAFLKGLDVLAEALGEEADAAGERVPGRRGRRHGGRHRHP
ncbi:MAG TPA: MarR family transcriptional regulator [Gaiellaceae bacterium]|nr:MarR family transcriptional regulator [Gaiellaceae bacterium]